jgi:hypothetical protein
MSSCFSIINELGLTRSAQEVLTFKGNRYSLEHITRYIVTRYCN